MIRIMISRPRTGVLPSTRWESDQLPSLTSTSLGPGEKKKQSIGPRSMEVKIKSSPVEKGVDSEGVTSPRVHDASPQAQAGEHHGSFARKGAGVRVLACYWSVGHDEITCD